MRKYAFTIILSLFSLFAIILFVSGYDNKGFLLALTGFTQRIIYDLPSFWDFPVSTRVTLLCVAHFLTYFSLGLIIDLIRKWFKNNKN